MSLSKTQAEEIIKSCVGALRGLVVQGGEGLFISIDANKLICVSATENRLISSLQSVQEHSVDGIICKVCDLNNINAELVRRNIKWTAPSAVGTGKFQAVSIDESGQQLEVLFKQGVKPVFVPVNSDEKNYRGFLDQITWKVVQAGYKRGYGADTGLLETEEAIIGALVLGYSRLNLDCATKVNEDIIKMNAEQIDVKYAALPEDFRGKLEDFYLEKKFKTAGGKKITFSIEDLKHIALAYAEVIVYARYVHSTYLKNAPWPVDFIINTTNSQVALTEQAHYLILNELERLGVQASGLY